MFFMNENPRLVAHFWCTRGSKIVALLSSTHIDVCLETVTITQPLRFDEVGMYAHNLGTNGIQSPKFMFTHAGRNSRVPR